MEIDWKHKKTKRIVIFGLLLIAMLAGLFFYRQQTQVVLAKDITDFVWAPNN